MFDFGVYIQLGVSPTPFFDHPSMHHWFNDPDKLRYKVAGRFGFYYFIFDFFFTEDLLLFTLPRFGWPQSIFKQVLQHVYFVAICCKLNVIELGLTKERSVAFVWNSWYMIHLIGHFLFFIRLGRLQLLTLIFLRLSFLLFVGACLIFIIFC